MEIRDKTFVVTGGGNGIGREVVLELLRRGGRVAAVDRDEDGLSETSSLAGSNATRLSLHPTDITDRHAVEALPETVRTAHGLVDGVVNVAGIIHRFSRVSELSIEEIERVMAVNFWGTVHIVKAFLPGLLKRPAASLVNVASMGALVPAPGQGAYGASKAAVKLFTETLHGELQGTGVRVTIAFPGGVGTNIMGNSGVEFDTSKLGKGTKTTAPADAGRQIVDAVAAGTFRVLIGADARGIDRLGRLAPKLAIDTVANRARALLG
jgi:short-subunit dehydrogenase